MAIELPDELLVQILSILPAKSLLRCRSVCKSWLNLMSSTKFKLMHLRNFNQLNPRYFVRRMNYFAAEELYDVHFDDEAFGLDSGTEIEFPFDRNRLNVCFRIIGSCNGVVCLSDDGEFTKGAFSLFNIILWNPSIRRKLTLPPHPMFYSLMFENPIVVVGFGYDKMSDDYKFVCLTYRESSSSTARPKVEVYTVKSGIWREVMFPHNFRCFCIQFDCSRIFSNGSVHWIARDPTPGASHRSIITFDITTELFGEIQLPEFSADGSLMLSVVGESLCVIHFSQLSFDGLKKSRITYMVMVMKEYKNPTSWTMLYHMHYTGLAMGRPLRLRNNGDMIVDLENGDVIILNHNVHYVDYVDYRTYVDRYQESLALLDVGDSIPNKEEMEVFDI